jgi:hypothetical protein
MLKSTFTIFTGIGPRKEYDLWKRGVKSWNDLLADEDCTRAMTSEIGLAEEALLRRDAGYFTRRLRPSDRWRILHEFASGAAFIDVELDGWGMYSEPVVVGILAHGTFNSFVKGVNLSTEAVLRKLGDAEMLVSYNGTRHDIHYIHRIIPDIEIRYPAVDLVDMAKKAKLFGGLKAVERRFDIRRSQLVELSANGRAVNLWNMWKRKGSRGALNLLKQYNMDDTCNLKPVSEAIMHILYAKTTGGVLDG